MWSIAAVCHAFATGTIGFGVARIFLGVFEAGNFPAAIKTTAEWFPKKERALATGIFNSGTNIGALLAPLTVPLIAQKFGWQWAFIITGAFGFLWLVCWLLLYEIPSRHRKLSLTEFEYIHSDGDDKPENLNDDRSQKNSWFRLLTFRQTWALILGKFLTDPVWWFYLFWLPAFLKAQYGITGTGVMFPVALVYTLSSAGSICGGWIPLVLIRKGVTVFRARKTAMLIYACCALPVIFAQYLGSLNMWLAVLTIGFAAAAHQAWSANIFTTASDMFPKKKVGSVTGLGGMAGALGGMVIARFAGVLGSSSRS